jgi:LysM repeat protein
MHFAEAEEQYRELETKLLGGELTEDDFAAQAGQLRLVDEDGRRWMISARTGRWLVYDGQRWVFAERPQGKPEPKAEAATVIVARPDGQDAASTIVAPVTPAKAPARKKEGPRATAPRLLVMGVTALFAILCLVGAGVGAWALFLRDWGEATAVPTDVAVVAAVETYTPRPATPTYTPTWTPTPSRTPTPTITPIPSNTPIPTNTPTFTPTPRPLPPTTTPQDSALVPSATVVALVSDTPTATSTASANQTYVVKQGETLSEIAVRFGVSVQALADANGISNPALIRAGQVLIIPAQGATPTPTWTPIVLITPSPGATTIAQVTSTPSPVLATATPTQSPTSAPSPTPTKSGPTATPKPTNTPKPTAVPTAKPATLTGKLAFTVWNPYTRKYELYVSLTDGSGRNMLGEGFRQPQFRPDGNLLAVNGDGAPNLEHLVTMDASGGGKVEVSNYSEDSYPTWSADGAIVAYSSASWGDGLVRLGVVNDMFGKNQDWIHVGTTQIQGQYPFWMADGRVVYNGCDFLGDGGSCGLYWVGAGGGNYHRLTTHQSDTAPAGSGSRVAFMSARDDNWEIYAVNMDGSALKRLTNSGSMDGLPTWSPDGKSIAFVSNRSGAWAIWVMNADGSNQRKLFDLGGGYGSGAYDWTTERISWAP